MPTTESSVLGLPRPVWLLGWVSLATDAASEAIYALLPFFLTQVLGATAVALGIVEGAAEAVNSIVKIASGRMTDRTRSKRRIVLAGYGLSSAIRPFMAVAQTWAHVFSIRVFDRVGKGVRGAPRDAMLAEYATPETRGKVFGFHQSMDNLGAVVGPAAATVFLLFYPDRYRTLFALTAIPGAIAVLLIFLIPEAGRPSVSPSVSTAANPAVPQRVADPANPPLPREFTSFMAVLMLFTLGNSSDAFLLLRLTDVAGSARFVPLMWSGLHVVKASVSTLGGAWSDRIGRRRVIAVGWVVYAIVYAGFAISESLSGLLFWFLVYGFYFGFAEGTEKALIADLAPASKRGLAFGVFTAVQGLGGLAASIVFGVIWKAVGPEAAFFTGAALAIAATASLYLFVPARASASI